MPGGDGPKWTAGTQRIGELDRPRRAVMAALAERMRDGDGLEKLLGVGGDALTRSVRANRAVRRSPTMPAIERYTGVLYDALDAGSLPTRSRARLDKQVLVFSAVFGLVAPGDPIPDHRLKMTAALPGIGKLSTYWRPHIDGALGSLVADRTVWNLLPNEHDAAWRERSSVGCEIDVRFLDDVDRGGERQLVVVSHWNKLLKGALVRHVLSTQLRDPEGLSRFEHPLGYRYEPALTEVKGTKVSVALVARR